MLERSYRNPTVLGQRWASAIRHLGIQQTACLRGVHEILIELCKLECTCMYLFVSLTLDFSHTHVTLVTC